MIKRLELCVYKNKGWFAQHVYNQLEFVERLDEELDTGTAQVIPAPRIVGENLPFDEFSSVRISLRDDKGTTKTGMFYGVDDVSKRGEHYYIHDLELFEPTRQLMGLPIDGRKVTQPIDNEKKKTLYDVLNELLEVAFLREYNTPIRYAVAEQSRALLERVISPEFHWECATMLWECLCDIGNVVNGIPRLIAEDLNSPDFIVITFDKVNEVTGEFEL